MSHVIYRQPCNSFSGCGLTGNLFYVFLFRDPAIESYLWVYDILTEWAGAVGAQGHLQILFENGMRHLHLHTIDPSKSYDQVHGQ